MIFFFEGKNIVVDNIKPITRLGRAWGDGTTECCIGSGYMAGKGC